MLLTDCDAIVRPIVVSRCDGEVGQQALVANATPAGRHDTAFGHYTFAASLGQALGPGVILLFVFGGTQTIPRTEAIFTSAVALAVATLGVTFLLRPWRTAPVSGPTRGRVACAGCCAGPGWCGP